MYTDFVSSFCQMEMSLRACSCRIRVSLQPSHIEWRHTLWSVVCPLVAHLNTLFRGRDTGPAMSIYQPDSCVWLRFKVAREELKCSKGRLVFREQELFMSPSVSQQLLQTAGDPRHPRTHHAEPQTGRDFSFTSEMTWWIKSSFASHLSSASVRHWRPYTNTIAYHEQERPAVLWGRASVWL